MNLKEKIIIDFIENDKIDILFDLLKSNKLIDINGIIDMKILTNSNLIINIVENYSDLLKKLRYNREILLTYELLTNISELILNDYINNVLNDYIDNILKFNNFNDNDLSYLYFLLYIHINKIIINSHDKLNILNIINNKFHETDNIQKIIGFIRYNELNLIDKYFKLWSIFNSYDDREQFKDKYEYKDKNFKYTVNFGDYTKYIELNNDFNFKIYEGYIHNRAEFWYENKEIGNIIKYDNKYYIENYKKYCGICARNYLIDETNRFITHASRNINDILPFLKEKCWELDEHYKGSIINNNYVKTNIFKNDINFSHDNIYEILIECGMFL